MEVRDVVCVVEGHVMVRVMSGWLGSIYSGLQVRCSWAMRRRLLQTRCKPAGRGRIPTVPT